MTTRTRTATPKIDPYEVVTEKIIALLEQGTAPWHQPWDNKGPAAGVPFPMSMSSRRPYRGINIWLLAAAAMEHGYRSPWWGTYKQITERGGQVRKGEKSELVILWKPFTVVDKETGKEEKRSMLRTFRVFNAEQADGLDDLIPAPADEPADDEARDIEQIEACEAALAAYYLTGPGLAFRGDVAYYSPSEDRVQIPDRDQFHSASAFYGTWFHETVHSTGHADRLDREGIANLPAGHRFGDALYSKEELVAEMGAAFLAGRTGIAADTLPASASYLAHWVEVLRGDKRLVIAAAAQAQRAVDLILGDAPKDEAPAAAELATATA